MTRETKKNKKTEVEFNTERLQYKLNYKYHHQKSTPHQTLTLSEM